MGIFPSKQDREAEKAYLEIRRKKRQPRPDAWLYDFVDYVVSFLDLYKIPLAIGGFVFFLLMALLGFLS